jgi:membrane fusion protein (multidrug efflux system)
METRMCLRRRLLMTFGLLVVILGGGAAAWWFIESSAFVTTDNAYVVADVANVMAQTAGTVKEVHASETQMVHRGEVLVLLDDADARIALAQAQAEYARVQRRVRQYFEDDKAGAAQVAYQEALLKQASTDLERRRNLARSGAVSAQDLSNAQAAYDTAVAALNAARSRYESQLAMTAKSDPDTHPEVLGARAALDAARLALERTVIRAPIDGTVVQRRVALGQRLQSGAPLMTLVPLLELYVLANYKEVQLQDVRPGQRATLTADLYGRNVVYHGRVAGLGGGTGSAFAVIPAQNATGSWIKVVQRLPVRIELDRAELLAHPLRVGLSMHSSIDLRK